ncbi:MAG: hypothetical protein ABI836_00955 [Gemmatimonadota bacterium]
MTYTTYEFTDCPVCGTPEGIEIADADALRAEVELLRAFHESSPGWTFQGADISEGVSRFWNTFERRYDSRAALIKAGELLRQGGWMDHFGRIVVCLLAHNNLLTFHYCQGFTRRSIQALFEKCFAIVGVFGATLVPVADQWTTGYGALEERWVKRMQGRLQRGWKSPWIEVYARALPK